MSNSRNNNATRAIIYRDQLFASGTFKNVYEGEYTVGARRGQRCVSKEFKTGSVYETHYFNEEMNIIRCTQKVIDDWHNADVISQRILLNTPQIWTYDTTGAKNLVEPMIENFEKFNSNSGWADTTSGAWSQAMQALSHFSYHNSGGQLLLCDLQGGSYRDGYILSDPVIMSQLQNYGPTDLGPEGIRSFFQRHQCGQFCRREWHQPKYQGKAKIPMRQGTSMVARLPTRASRNPLSRLQE
ncbi:kinase-like domain-containing protein [Ustulina deusta]|nr:kinase-like domain-containing protein [Ustulina deusta]